MIELLLSLIVLLLVIFDPPASFAVFLTATSKMHQRERNRIAFLAIMVAAALSYAVLLAGEGILLAFRTNISDFRIAGGVILSILGIKMALGHSLANIEKAKGNSSRAIAAIIGTPLLTGPAAISAIISSVSDYGIALTGLAITFTLIITAGIFMQATRIKKLTGTVGIQVISTIFGLITLAWGVSFIRAGLGI